MWGGRGSTFHPAVAPTRPGRTGASMPQGSLRVAASPSCWVPYFAWSWGAGRESALPPLYATAFAWCLVIGFEPQIRLSEIFSDQSVYFYVTSYERIRGKPRWYAFKTRLMAQHGIGTVPGIDQWSPQGCPRLRPGRWPLLKSVVKSHNIKFTVVTIFRCAVRGQ